MRTLLHYFAVTQNSTHFFSSDSALFVKKPEVGEVAHVLAHAWVAFLHLIR
jgi:hypothetical protein